MPAFPGLSAPRSEEHTSELQSQSNLVCRLLLEKKTHRHAAVDLRRLFPDNHETSSREAGMNGDNRLGLNEPISRRDFLNGALLAGAGLLLHGKAPTISPSPTDGFNGYGGSGDYRHPHPHTPDVLRAR